MDEKDFVLTRQGHTIVEAVMTPNEELYLKFSDDKAFVFVDDGQSCCEYRHMTTDDDLKDMLGAKIVNVEVVDGPDHSDGWYVHEIQFLNIETTNGPFQFVNHNEHNGYYGGFMLRISKGAV